MRTTARLIDTINRTIGQLVAWFALLIVLVQFLIVLQRYLFGIGSIMVQESVLYMHASLFMLAAAYTLAEDGHVRVDIFYREAAPRRKAMVNLFGALFLLIPVCLMILWIAWPYVAASWAVREGSREASGIPGIYILKTVILIFAAQLVLQGVSMVLHSLAALAGDEEELAALRVPGGA